jgi:ABC-type transport system involved in multi-copper enzyme maturation permease subunit
MNTKTDSTDPQKERNIILARFFNATLMLIAISFIFGLIFTFVDIFMIPLIHDASSLIISIVINTLFGIIYVCCVVHVCYSGMYRSKETCPENKHN